MKKVVCANNTDYENFLTLGKTYEVIKEYITRGKTYEVTKKYLTSYIIMNDKGYKHFYPTEWFKSLHEYRNEKIERLLR